tara:strand:+ start:535 stop:2088 length:1554 start_codon:yes stop_codon:yes gene_type:complete
MKLIRLTSTENTAIFDNTLNDPISLNPGASVAMSNVIIASQEKNLIIDGTNHILKWSINGGTTTQEVPLPAGTYNKSNIENLFGFIEASFNDNHDIADFDDPDEAGMDMMWKCEINDGKKSTPGHEDNSKNAAQVVVMGYRTASTGPSKSDVETAFKGKEFVTISTDQSAIISMTGSNSEDSYLFGSIPMTWGGGAFGLGFEKMTDNGSVAAAQGVFFGLTQTNHLTDQSTPTRDECVFGIHCPHDGTPYIIYEGSTATVGDTDVDVDTGGVWIARINGHLYPFARKPDDLSWGQILKESDDSDIYVNWDQSDHATTPLYPYVIFYGESSNTQINSLQYSPDPYKWIDARLTNYLDAPQNDSVWNPINGRNPVKPTTRIDIGVPVAEFLGYLKGAIGAKSFPAKEGTYQITNHKSFGWWAPVTQAQAGEWSDSFYVELLSLGCEGYDGLTGGRKNILATIPASDKSNQLIYDVHNPLFLDIGNAFPITLRNISARVLTSDGASVPADGLNVLTLLFQ